MTLVVPTEARETPQCRRLARAAPRLQRRHPPGRGGRRPPVDGQWRRPGLPAAARRLRSRRRSTRASWSTRPSSTGWPRSSTGTGRRKSPPPTCSQPALVASVRAARAALLDALELRELAVGLIDSYRSRLTQLLAELRHWHGVCLTIMHAQAPRPTVHHQDPVRGVSSSPMRLPSAPSSAGSITWQQYPGTMGLVLALCCTGVVFLAGGKLLDSVRPAPALAIATPRPPAMPRAAAAPSVVIDPGFAGRPPPQGQPVRPAEIDAAPHGGAAAGDASPSNQTRNRDR